MIWRSAPAALKTRDKSQAISKTRSGAKAALSQADCASRQASPAVDIAEPQVVVLAFRNTSL
jgi:hypothetical protein